MRELTEKDLEWQKGFEAGIAFAVRHYEMDISKFILDLEHLRAWRTEKEWRELVEKNCIDDYDSRKEH